MGMAGHGMAIFPLRITMLLLELLMTLYEGMQHLCVQECLTKNLGKMIAYLHLYFCNL